MRNPGQGVFYELLWYSCSDEEGSHAVHRKKERDDGDLPE